jgi:hypothetical protein
MSTPSKRSRSVSQFQTSVCGWREFLLESLCGVLTVAWYLLALAERSTFQGLRRLTRFADALSDDPSNSGDQFDVVFDQPELAFAMQHDDIHASCHERETMRLAQSPNPYPLSEGWYHISWILILAGLTRLGLLCSQAQVALGSALGSAEVIISEAETTVTDTRTVTSRGVLSNGTVELRIDT